MVVGDNVVEKIRQAKVFMVGVGAIGCELLKNYAMVGVATSHEQGKRGALVMTDPDVIENSNLNRQFLFREKHIRKPKSLVAAAAVMRMNEELKGNVVA